MDNLVARLFNHYLVITRIFNHYYMYLLPEYLFITISYFDIIYQSYLNIANVK